jgi:hypothetical protein
MAISEEQRKKISDGRKKWLKENPDKHPWRSHNKFKSTPCEKAKEFLRSLGISFIEEYDPQIEGRNFSIDIALPDKMIALEINGNQHYERTGELKPYYKERGKLLEDKGWIVYEIHYSACFKLEKWADFVNQLKNSPVKVEFDYFTYVPREVKKWFCVECGEKVKRKVRRCEKCKPKKLVNGITKDRKKREPNLNKFCCICGIRKYSVGNNCRNCEKSLSTKNKCECGNYKHEKAKRCEPCAHLNSRKVKNRPSKEELEKLIWEKTFVELGKQFGVSDVAVKKWCKTYGITNIPSPSYRTKKYFESINNF